MNKQQTARRDFIKKTSFALASLAILPRHVVGGRGYVPPSDKINIGFIGTGRLANGYFDRFAKLPELNILGACDVNQKKLNHFTSQVEKFYQEEQSGSKHPPLKTFKDYRELLSMDQLDAAVICTPDHWHAIQAIDAMKAGKDVYCEKPLSHTIFEGREMVNAAIEYQRVVQTGSMQRSSRDFRHACELVRNGYLGEIRRVLVNVGDPAIPYDLPGEPVPSYLDWDAWCGPGPVNPFNTIVSPPLDYKEWPQWRRYREYGGGILCDWGAHMFDIAQWGLGMDRSGPVKFIPPEDPEAKRGLKMIYSNGVEVVHEDFGRGWAVRFIGTEGSLDVSRSFLDSDPSSVAKTNIKNSDERLYYSENHYQDWVDAIRNRTDPIADVETGHRTASVCNLANIAYRLNEELDWDPVAEKFKGNKKANSLKTKKYRKPYTLD
jgi:predicted dehydrogenase